MATSPATIRLLPGVSLSTTLLLVFLLLVPLSTTALSCYSSSIIISPGSTSRTLTPCRKFYALSSSSDTRRRRWPLLRCRCPCRKTVTTAALCVSRTGTMDNDDYGDDDNFHRNNGNRSIKAAASTSPRPSSSGTFAEIIKTSFLIAGTTVGGGFLALPQTVVVPLGGFPPAAISLAMVWFFLLGQSWILCTCLVECYQATHQDGLGLVYLTRHVLSKNDLKAADPDAMIRNKEESADNSKSHSDTTYHLLRRLRMPFSFSSSLVVSWLLILLTEATLVSQLARAGILYADLVVGPSSSKTFMNYRLGCTMAALVGAIMSFADNRRTAGVASPDDSNNNRLATNVNAVLTAIFLASAVLLFHAGQTSAQWSHCMSTTTSNRRLLFSTLGKAMPIMLQLLVYGEILPNVCHMLKYNLPHIQKALVLGSFLPLILLTGWAALGVALLPPSSFAAVAAAGAAVQDPVTVLLATGSSAVQQRLVWLAISAIGTTILGSFLALQTAYRDLFRMDNDDTNANNKEGKQPQQDRKDHTNDSAATTAMSPPQRQHWGMKNWLRQSWTEIVAIVIPPLAISLISPSLFLQAIEFAGAYPGLLLYGVIPPVLFHRLRRSSSRSSSKNRRKIRSNRMMSLMVHGLGLLSVTMVAFSALGDLQKIAVWLYQCFRSKLT
jgi:amino acid permease